MEINSPVRKNHSRQVITTNPGQPATDEEKRLTCNQTKIVEMDSMRKQIICNKKWDSKLRHGIPRVVLHDIYAHEKSKGKISNRETEVGSGRMIKIYAKTGIEGNNMVQIGWLEDKNAINTSRKYYHDFGIIGESKSQKTFTNAGRENEPNSGGMCTFATSISETVKLKSRKSAVVHSSKTISKVFRKKSRNMSVSTSDERVFSQPSSPPVIQLDSDSEIGTMQVQDNLGESEKVGSGRNVESSLSQLFFEEDLEGMDLNEEDDDFMHRLMGLPCSKTSNEKPVNSVNSEDSSEEMSLSSYAKALKSFLGDDESSDDDEDEDSMTANEDLEESKHSPSRNHDVETMEIESDSDSMEALCAGSPFILEVESELNMNSTPSQSCPPVMKLSNESGTDNDSEEPPFRFEDILEETAISSPMELNKDDVDAILEGLLTPTPSPNSIEPMSPLNLDNSSGETAIELIHDEADSDSGNSQPPTLTPEKENESSSWTSLDVSEELESLSPPQLDVFAVEVETSTSSLNDLNENEVDSEEGSIPPILTPESEIVSNAETSLENSYNNEAISTPDLDGISVEAEVSSPTNNLDSDSEEIEPSKNESTEVPVSTVADILQEVQFSRRIGYAENKVNSNAVEIQPPMRIPEPDSESESDTEPEIAVAGIPVVSRYIVEAKNTIDSEPEEIKPQSPVSPTRSENEPSETDETILPAAHVPLETKIPSRIDQSENKFPSESNDFQPPIQAPSPESELVDESMEEIFENPEEETPVSQNNIADIPEETPVSSLIELNGDELSSILEEHEAPTPSSDTLEPVRSSDIETIPLEVVTSNPTSPIAKHVDSKPEDLRPPSTVSTDVSEKVIENYIPICQVHQTSKDDEESPPPVGVLSIPHDIPEDKGSSTSGVINEEKDTISPKSTEEESSKPSFLSPILRELLDYSQSQKPSNQITLNYLAQELEKESLESDKTMDEMNLITTKPTSGTPTPNVAITTEPVQPIEILESMKDDCITNQPLETSPVADVVPISMKLSLEASLKGNDTSSSMNTDSIATKPKMPCSSNLHSMNTEEFAENSVVTCANSNSATVTNSMEMESASPKDKNVVVEDDEEVVSVVTAPEPIPMEQSESETSIVTEDFSFSDKQSQSKSTTSFSHSSSSASPDLDVPTNLLKHQSSSSAVQVETSKTLDKSDPIRDSLSKGTSRSKINFHDPEERIHSLIPVSANALETPAKTKHYSSTTDDSSHQNEEKKRIKTITCPMCRKEYRNQALMDEHIVVYHCNMLFDESKHPSLTELQFKLALERFFIHYVSKGECPPCKFSVPAGKKFTLRMHLVKDHFNEVRKNLITFQEEWLPYLKLEEDPDEYVKRYFELKMEGPLTSFVCNICGESMKRNNLLDHLGTHGFHAMKKCTFCNDLFGRASARTSHELMEHCELLFQNENIHKLSKKAWTRVVHNVLDNILDVYSDKPNKCPLCLTFKLSERQEKVLRWREHMVFRHLDYVKERILVSQRKFQPSVEDAVKLSCNTPPLPRHNKSCSSMSSSSGNTSAKKSANPNIRHPPPTVRSVNNSSIDLMHPSSVPCKYCCQTFPNIDLLNDHVFRSHSDNLFSTSSNPFHLGLALDYFFSQYINMNKPTCHLCNIRFSKTEMIKLREHLVMEHFEELRNALAKFQRECYRQHLENTVKRSFTPHPNDPQYCFCNICGIKQIINNYSFQMKHLRFIHGYGMVKCGFCEETFYISDSRLRHELRAHCDLLFQGQNTRTLPKDEFLKVVYGTLDELLGFHVDIPKKNRCPLCPTYTLTETSEKFEMTKLNWRVHMVTMHFPFVCEKIMAFQSRMVNVVEGKESTSVQLGPQISNHGIQRNPHQQGQTSLASVPPNMMSTLGCTQKRKFNYLNTSVSSESLDSKRFKFSDSLADNIPCSSHATCTTQDHLSKSGIFSNGEKTASPNGEAILTKSGHVSEKTPPIQARRKFSEHSSRKRLSSFSIASILSERD